MYSSQRAASTKLRHRLFEKATSCGKKWSSDVVRSSRYHSLSGLASDSTLIKNNMQAFGRQSRFLSAYSSLSEPSPTIFDASRLSATKSGDDEDDLDKHLRSDVKAMGAILGKILKEHSGNDIFDKVENLRSFAKVSIVNSYIRM